MQWTDSLVFMLKHSQLAFVQTLLTCLSPYEEQSSLDEQLNSIVSRNEQKLIFYAIIDCQWILIMFYHRMTQVGSIKSAMKLRKTKFLLLDTCLGWETLTLQRTKANWCEVTKFLFSVLSHKIKQWSLKADKEWELFSYTILRVEKLLQVRNHDFLMPFFTSN